MQPQRLKKNYISVNRPYVGICHLGCRFQFIQIILLLHCNDVDTNPVVLNNLLWLTSSCYAMGTCLDVSNKSCRPCSKYVGAREYQTRKAWHQSLKLSLEKIRDGRQFDTAAFKKLWHLYRLSTITALLRFQLNDLLYTSWKTGWTPKLTRLFLQFVRFRHARIPWTHLKWNDSLAYFIV